MITKIMEMKMRRILLPSPLSTMKLTLWSLLVVCLLHLSSSALFVTHHNPLSCRQEHHHHPHHRNDERHALTTTQHCNKAVLSSHKHGQRGFAVTPLFGKTLSAKARMKERWYTGVMEEPSSSKSSSSSSSSSSAITTTNSPLRQEQIEEKCLAVASTIISNRLVQRLNDARDKETHDETTESQTTLATNNTIGTRAHDLAKGRFQDLTMTKEGSQVLESLFLDESLVHVTDDVILYGTIYLVQSLCIMGMLVGVKGSPEQEQRRVQHLKEIDTDHANNDDGDGDGDDDNWTDNTKIKNKSLQDMSIGNLKYLSDQTAGTQLLAQLSLKRTTQGAMDLLIALGAWSKHEDLSLLRSGFPILFTDKQLQAAETAAQDTADVDELLGIRRDLTHHKVYTIDSESTSEVDDGLSVEELEDGRLKFWIHIADADRWAPRDSSVFNMAKTRTTTHYLPTGPVPMFPPRYTHKLL